VSRFAVSVFADAETEIREAFLWYAQRSLLAADAFRSEVFEALDGLSVSAADWPADEDGTRRYHLRHFPYTVMYEIAGVDVMVLALAHQRRRPGYWRTR
jgi:plasmid stabilization system protein ParE